MVDEYNKRVEQQGIPSEEMWAFRGSNQDVPAELSGEKVDVIVVSA
jgi:hypothetical protein